MNNAIAFLVFYDLRRSFYSLQLLNDNKVSLVKRKMGLVRLKIREFADEKGWTLKEVSDRSGLVYSTVRAYARSPGMGSVDFTAIQKLARLFDVMIEDLVEVIEE